MVWQICIRYPNGQERALRSYQNREAAIRWVDTIYAQGYPMHVAYIVRPADPFQEFPSDLNFATWELA